MATATVERDFFRGELSFEEEKAAVLAMHGELSEAYSCEVLFLQEERDTFKKEAEDLTRLFEMSDGEFWSRGYKLVHLR